MENRQINILTNGYQQTSPGMRTETAEKTGWSERIASIMKVIRRATKAAFSLLHRLWLLWAIVFGVVAVASTFKYEWALMNSRYADSIGGYAWVLLAYAFGDCVVLRGIKTRKALQEGNIAYALVLSVLMAAAVVVYAAS